MDVLFPVEMQKELLRSENKFVVGDWIKGQPANTAQYLRGSLALLRLR
jgi:hypothetical protein